jgi:hypothetical protein
MSSEKEENSALVLNVWLNKNLKKERKKNQNQKPKPKPQKESAKTYLETNHRQV